MVIGCRGADGSRTHDLWFTRPTPYHLATAPAATWRSARFRMPFPVVASRWRPHFAHFSRRFHCVSYRILCLNFQRISICSPLKREKPSLSKGREQGVVKFRRVFAVSLTIICLAILSVKSQLHELEMCPVSQRFRTFFPLHGCRTSLAASQSHQHIKLAP